MPRDKVCTNWDYPSDCHDSHTVQSVALGYIAVQHISERNFSVAPFLCYASLVSRATPPNQKGKGQRVHVQRVVLRQDLVASNQIQIFSHMT